MRVLLRIGVAFALTSCSGAASSPSAKLSGQPPEIDPNTAPKARLGQATVPVAYRLELDLDPREGSFRGNVSIDIDVRKPVHTIWLHSKELQVSRASLEQGGESISLETVTSEGDSELLGLRAYQDVAPGAARLHLSWAAKLGSIQGLFRQVESRRWYIYSDFEATDARAAFPCYDDPRFKTPWTIMLKVPSEHLAFSNAPEVGRNEFDGGKTEFQFAPTRPLPSYLVAMAAGPFDLIEGTASNTPLRIIAPKHQAKHGAFVLKSTGAMLQYLEEYLDMPLPFPKLDFIAVPRFGGAMENPGLVTFSSDILLVGEDDSASARRRALGVTAHELAHLWFGDYITPDYWNELWLNEGFATWLSDKAVAAVSPHRAKDVLDIADKTAAYILDHRPNARRVREPVENRDDIRAAFDHITYRKGGAILAMMEGWLGDKRMQDAVRQYLSDGDGGTVVTERLIRSVVDASGNGNVKPFLDSFLSQTGIPQVHASLSCDGAPKLFLRQSRYLPLQARATTEQRTWHLPACVRYPLDASGTKTIRQCIDFDTQEVEMPLRTRTCPGWLLPNDGDSGYYHYLLSAKAYANLPLDSLSPREALGLAHSISAAMHAGKLGVGESLDLIEPMLATKSTKVHLVIRNLLYYLANSVVGERERPAFAAMVRRWYQPLARRIGVTPEATEAPWISEIRPHLLLVLADLGEDSELRQMVLKKVDSWLDSHQDIDLLLLNSWLQVAALGGDAALASRYHRVRRARKNRAHRYLIIGALHGFRNPELLAETIVRSWRVPAGWPILAKAMRHLELRESVFSLLPPNEIDKEDLALLFAPLCDQQAVTNVRTFAKGNDDIEVESLIEPIRDCMAFAKAQAESAAKRFAPQP